MDVSEHVSGFIAIIGPPNAGKSTLLNRLLGRKVSIVSPKPQTTRNRITGICSGEGYQMIFIDTPGVHQTRTPLHESMVASAMAAFSEVDIVLLVIEMTRPDDPDVSLAMNHLKGTKKPTILVINKIDKGPVEALLGLMDRYRQEYDFTAIVPVSALKGDGVDSLFKELRSKLRPGPAFFPKEMTTDQSEKFLISEIIREKIYTHTRKELPYSCAVTVENLEENAKGDLLSIIARIHVESESQKGILIGSRGRMVKGVGQASRLELERILETRIFLDLQVRVEKNWSREPKSLKKLGY